uniref:Fibronectin type III domain protein n=1 Tax=Geobacter sp. (strain M21) TaxID=443144 RepID=C6DZV1_GEOSM
MKDINLRKLKSALPFWVLLLLPLQTASAQVLFSDSFDNRADWSVPYTSSDQTCNTETGCTNVPAGYYGYYISRSVITPATGRGLYLDSVNRRGASGKGLTFWDQSDGALNWTSGMQIGVDFAPQREVYLRYWIKMQTGYVYYKGPDGSMMRKLNHISHYVYNGKPFTFFSDGGHHPTTVNQLRFGNVANKANLQNLFFIRPDTNYGGLQPTTMVTTPLSIRDSAGVGVYNYFDLPDDALAKGNWDGTGTEYNSPGVIADGRWHCLEFYLKNNSAPGLADGAYKFWLDGVPQIDSTGLLYRDAASALPDNIWNFVHVGGNAINPFLGVGLSGEQWYAVDDLVISTSYSGVPPKPANVSGSGVSDTAIKLSWRAGSFNTSYPLDGYRIYYGTDASNLTNSVAVASTVTEATITSLTPATRYHFAVTAYSRGSGDANDNESLRATASAVTADAVPPVVILNSVPPITMERSLVITGTVTDAGGIASVTVKVGTAAAVVATVSGNAWSCNIAALTEGRNSILVTARDVSGNQSEVTELVLLDTTPPALTVRPVVTPPVYTSQTITGTVSDLWGVSSVLVQLDGGEKKQAVVNGSAWSYLSENLKPGAAIKIAVTAVDTAGNETSQTATAAGDLSGDVSLGVEDVQIAMQMAAQLKNPDVEQLKRADLAPMVGGVSMPDGIIDTGDAVLMLGLVTGMVTFK